MPAYTLPIVVWYLLHIYFLGTGFPAAMEQDELDTHVEGARALLADEAARSGPPTSS